MKEWAVHTSIFSCTCDVIELMSLHLLSKIYLKFELNGITTQCKNSWNSCQDLAYSYIFPFTLATLDKTLFILASHKLLEFFDSILGKSLIKSFKRMNSCKTNINFVYKYFAVVRTTSFTIIL